MTTTGISSETTQLWTDQIKARDQQARQSYFNIGAGYQERLDRFLPHNLPA